ncbi:ankyrin repeat domain-containing protein [Chryseobacterium lathyri]|jgi:ankyrin repeat protein|uniref:Ankyrin repeat-containing protein n=1 Tax=Chryseobacterium lathyri TaxID=395933 RepID=A0A511YCI9_9FLAO|nr:ankyrin repeat domain-containing protein [Chryseobacterium lathyri]GEN72902.1 ankyrin repeat-containing protein [Chryseobacterium lathyri]
MKNIIFIISIFLSFSALSAQEKVKSIFDIARSGTVAEVKELIKQDPDIINKTNENGFSTLILACYRGNTPVAEFLITHVKNINYASGEGTALTASVFKGDKNLTQKLLENKADPNIADTNGITPLIYAVQSQNKEIVELLLKNKANKTLSDKQGKTIFEYALFSKNQDIINLLKN